MFLKSVRVVCDECCESALSVVGGSTDVALAAAKHAGWLALKHPSRDSWKPRIHVCARCVEYGRPYERDGQGRMLRALAGGG